MSAGTSQGSADAAEYREDEQAQRLPSRYARGEETSSSEEDEADCRNQRRQAQKLRCWAWTIHYNDVAEGEKDCERLLKVLREMGGKWGFQLEKGEQTGRIHAQGWTSFKQPKRPSEVKLALQIEGNRWNCSRVANRRGVEDYCRKEEGRLAGPWSHLDREVPRQFRGIRLWDWQRDLASSCDEWTPRIVNVLYDPAGGVGKSTVCGVLCTKPGATASMCPVFPTVKDTSRAVYGIVEANPRVKTFFFDVPRALGPTLWVSVEFVAALEAIKNGHITDDRYKYREKWIDSPNIWVFTNVLPEYKLLTHDRWRVWVVDATTQKLKLIHGPRAADQGHLVFAAAAATPAPSAPTAGESHTSASGACDRDPAPTDQLAPPAPLRQASGRSEAGTIAVDGGDVPTDSDDEPELVQDSAGPSRVERAETWRAQMLAREVIRTSEVDARALRMRALPRDSDSE